MNKPYWYYETSIGNELCVSLRCNKNVDLKEFRNYINKFLCTYSNRVYNFDLPIQLYDGSHQIVIRLKGREPIEFENPR